jgi:hypothetical protein
MKFFYVLLCLLWFKIIKNNFVVFQAILLVNTLDTPLLLDF